MIRGAQVELKPLAAFDDAPGRQEVNPTPAPQAKTTAPVSKQRFQLNCNCGFMLASHDRNEVVNLSTTHVNNKHKDMKLGQKDIEGMIKSI